MDFFEIWGICLGICGVLWFLDKVFGITLYFLYRCRYLLLITLGISALIFGFSWCWANFSNENWNAVFVSVILFSPVIYILYDKRKFKKYVKQNPGTKTDW
jgi:hypothetical protein